MRVDDLKLSAIGIDCHPQRAARLIFRQSGQGRCPHKRHRLVSQDGIAVLFLSDVQRDVEMIFDFKPMEECLGSAGARRTQTPDAEFLQADGVRSVLSDDTSNADNYRRVCEEAGRT